MGLPNLLPTTSFSNPQRRTNNPDDAIGYDIVMDDACIDQMGTGIQNAIDNLVPNNGEYEYAKREGQCNGCTGCMPRRGTSGFGADRDWNYAFAGGMIPYYHRKSYLAPKDQCCTNNGARTIGAVTCDPQYTAGVGAPACNDIYAAQCIGQTNSNILNSTCQTWCKANTDACNAAISNFCAEGSNLDRDDCKAHALEIGGADLDIAANRWCADHMDDPFCACLKAVSLAPNAPSDAQKALSKPECYITECTSGRGYQNVNMRGDKNNCPEVNICNNSLIVAASTNVSLDKIQQTCDQSIGVNTSTSNKQTTSDTSTAPQGLSSIFTSTDKTVEYFILFITIIILFVSGIFLFSDDDDDSDQTNKSPYIEDSSKPSKSSEPLASSETLVSDDSWF
jgi:hypothetical protein